jgi:hypothetical protein
MVAAQRAATTELAPRLRRAPRHAPPGWFLDLKGLRWQQRLRRCPAKGGARLGDLPDAIRGEPLLETLERTHVAAILAKR